MRKTLDKYLADMGLTSAKYIERMVEQVIEDAKYVDNYELAKRDAIEWAEKTFGLTVKIPIKRTNQKRTLGLFKYTRSGYAHSITISRSLDNAYSTLRHELTHYALFEILGKDGGYSDGDEIFEKTLIKYSIPSNYFTSGDKDKFFKLYMLAKRLGDDEYDNGIKAMLEMRRRGQ